MLEANQWESNSFVTLTYDDEHLPANRSVDPRDMQLFLKRLRENVYPRRVRFYGVGEYGDVTYRPHYHLALFNLDTASVHVGGMACKCVVCMSWRLGGVHVGTLTSESAAYIVSYVLKRMTNHDDPRLAGRYPEFARMSLRPGIGAGAVPAIADVCTARSGAKYISENDDVPGSIRAGGKEWPLGRYLRKKVREAAGMDGRQSNGAARKNAAELKEKVIQMGGYFKRGEKRKQDALIAEARVRISQSKKGGKLS